MSIRSVLAVLVEDVGMNEVVGRLRGWCRRLWRVLAGYRRLIAGGGSRGLRMVGVRYRQMVFVLVAVGMGWLGWRM